MPGNKSKVKCSMASCMEWHQPCSAGRSRLAKVVSVWKWSWTYRKRKASYMNAFYNLVHFYLTPVKLGSARPNTDCLATLNGVCTKRNMTLTIYPLNKPSYFLFQDSASEVSYVYLWKNFMKMNWIWTKWQISVLAKIHILLRFLLTQHLLGDL